MLPRAFGKEKPALISLEEGIGKMRAALAARAKMQSLCIIGRTSAAAASPARRTRSRGPRAYAAAGVDGLFFAGGMTRAQLDAIAHAVRLPLLLGGVPAELSDSDIWPAGGVRIALQGHQPFSAAVQAVYDDAEGAAGGDAAGETGRAWRRGS